MEITSQSLDKIFDKVQYQTNPTLVPPCHAIQLKQVGMLRVLIDFLESLLVEFQIFIRGSILGPV